MLILYQTAYINRLLISLETVMECIRIRGARTHNLKNIHLDLPRNRLIVLTGLSGSGKSSLAFDTIYAEGQRRYVESLSSYARQFLSVMEKPDVDLIDGLSPAIAIEQKSTSHNPRSTVGTVTEIYDYLRLLFARVGEPRCPDHGAVLQAQTISQMVDQVLALPPGTKVMLLAPVLSHRKGEHLQLLDSLRRQGFVRARIDGEVTDLDHLPELDKQRKHSIEVVVDRFKIRPDLQSRLADSFETAIQLGDGLAYIVRLDAPPAAPPMIFSAKYSCPHCGYSLTELEPRMFSFNNPAGACRGCDGLGVQQVFDPKRVVPHPHLGVGNGAIRGWDRRNRYYFNLISSLAEHYHFDLDTPFDQLPPNIQQILLYGSDGEQIDFRYAGENGNLIVRRHAFEGVIPNMQRRYQQTESLAVREELARYIGQKTCDQCQGTRLRREARYVYVGGKTLPEVSAMAIAEALSFVRTLSLSGQRGQIAAKIVGEIGQRLEFLIDVGLDYLHLHRNADTLSGGEAQRIRLASQIGAGLVGVMYVLDEPSIGLHARDHHRLLNTLRTLRDLGNTVIVVEHDEEAIRAADHVVDIGPGAGIHGGHIVAEGNLTAILASRRSLTGDYLAGRRRIDIPPQRTPIDPRKTLRIRGACGNNLQDIDVDIPTGVLTCVTGVSGSGKSTLINDTLYRHAARVLNRSSDDPAPCRSIEGLELFDRVIDIDQSPIGRTPRSNPATYTGLFGPIRDLFHATPEARARGYSPGRFSFNVKGGRCEACQGDGMVKVEMHFLPDIYVACDVCRGKRYNRETLEIRYKGKNIAEVLAMTIEEARQFFHAVPALRRRLDTLLNVGLSYLTLGQSATTLSGGEAQRLKLARELSKRDTGRTLYVLDEPTTGLHFHDIKQLLSVLLELRDRGNTIVVIEHHLDVIKVADWVIDLGPEGGSNGGQVIVTGTPEAVAACSRSHTGRFLQPLLSDSRSVFCR